MNEMNEREHAHSQFSANSQSGSQSRERTSVVWIYQENG